MPADTSRRATAAASKQDFGGVAGGAKAFAYGAARGATAGASDLVFRTLGAEPEHLRGFVEENPITSAIGEGVGAAVPAFAAPASLLGRTPAGKISGLGRSIVESAEGAGAAGRIGAATVGAAVEGGIYGGGQYLSQVALEDKPLSAEGFVAGVGHGALFGGVAGGGFAGIGSGLAGAGAALQRARSLFPQRIVTKEAAKAVEKEATTALSAAVTDGDAMVAAVRQRIALTDTKIGMAEAGEGTTRRLFGAADPQSVTDQVAGTVDRNRLTSAVQKYEASKAQLSDWIREEADPSLEAALTGITAPDVAPGLRRTGAAWPPEPPDITRALRGGALGTPAEVPADLINGVRADVTRALKRPAAVAVGTPSGGVSDDLLRGVRDEASVVRASEVEHAATQRPIGQMSIAQLDELQQELNAKFDKAVSGTKEYDDLSKQWDEIAAHRRALRDGPVVAKPASTVSEHSAALSIEAYDNIKGPFVKSLSEEETEAALAYSGAQSDGINRALRRGTALSEKNAPRVALLDSLIAKSTTTDDMVVLRGIRGNDILEQFRGYKPGDVISDPAYTSTSTASHVEPQFDGDVELRMFIPKGTHAAPIPTRKAEERELLLPRNQKFRVDSSEYDAARKKLVVRVTAVADEAPGASARGSGDVVATAINGPPTSSVGIPEYHALDARLTKAGLDEIEETIPASAIAERGWYEMPGAHADEVRNANARKAIAEGQRDPIKLNVTPSGKITVSGGRHRLQAAVEADAPIRVKWSTGFEPAPGDVLRNGRISSGVEPAPGSGSLEDLLRGTKDRIDAGGSLKGAGRDSPAWKAVDLGPQSGKYETSAMAAEERAAQELAAAERAARPTTRPSAIDESARRFQEAKRVAQATGKPGSLDDLLAFRGHAAADMAAAGRRGALDAVEAAPANVAPPVDLGKTIVNREMRTQMRDIHDDFKIDQILAKRPGKNVDVGPDLKRAAKVIGDFEDAGADLVEILGPEAPAVAANNAKAYKAALAAQADARSASAAKAGEHLAEKVGPEVAAATGGRVASALGALADIGTAIEVLHTMGVHVPDIDAIPVIGPVLSLFLKARAVMGIVGRKGGSIGKSIEGTIAAKHAAVRDRMATATVSALDVGARGAKKLSAITAGPAVTLANKLFPGGPDPKSKDPRVLYAARMDELSRAMAPNAIAHAVSDRIQTADPHLQDAITSQVERGLKFIESKAPKQTLLPGMLRGDGDWKPSKVALEKWGRYVHAVNDPASVLEDLAKGHVTIEGAEVLRVVYPKLFAEAQRVLLEESAKLQRTLPYARRVMISIMYRVPVDSSMTPQHLQFLQPPAPAPMPGVQPMPGGAPQSAPAFTAPLNLGQQTMTSLDRRAGM